MQRFAASAEDYENQISQLRIVVTKAELGKTNAEEKVVFMAAEQVYRFSSLCSQ